MSATPTKAKYYLNKQGEFVIQNYNYAKPFANFFPGIAGKFGIPMWVFYVNRGQCVCSFGTKDKDRAILEFFPANKAWELTSSLGFRTFYKIKNAKSKPIYYEPFHNGYSNLKYQITNSMRIGSAELILEEENRSLGIKTLVKYFNIPNDTFAGLSRIVCVENTGHKLKSLQMIDGLPQIIPFGTNNFFLKKLGRTIEAWMKIVNLENSVPFYKLEVDPADRPEVVHINDGNFYLGFHFKNQKLQLLKPIVDPQAVFGAVTDFSYPAEFLAKPKFSYPAEQLIQGKTPSALLLMDLELKPAEQKIFYSVIGQARDSKTLNNSVKRIIVPGYLDDKMRQNRELIEKLKADIATKSSSAEFDLYAGQTYLDNIMRGGYPEVFKSGSVVYLYSRKHGDLERDYNKFQLQPTYLSQGNGNYRDANQNRRSDIWFNPDIQDENIISFMNLIQADGFNPLVVKPESFLIKESADLQKLLENVAKQEDLDRLGHFLKKPFTPGELIFFIEENKILLNTSYDIFLDLILSASLKTQEAEHGEGFWTDHWAYNLDLIDSYLGVYPEKANTLFFGRKIFSFFDNAEIVRPRSEKYVLYNGQPRQLHSLMLDNNKKEMLRKRLADPHSLRTLHGEGPVHYTTLTAKLLCLAANKLASLDASGVGIEMEANKPNWFDSLNGLPALFGSSICETFELKRLLITIKQALEKSPVKEIEMAEEIAKFIEQLSGLFAEETFSYWDKSNTVKENYRYNIRLGFSGTLTNVPVNKLLDFLKCGLEKVETGLTKAFDKTKHVYNSYFINEVSDYSIVKDHYIKPLKFTQKPAPLFLEGQMHALRLTSGGQQSLDLYQATKQSALFDKKLKMYKVTAPLGAMPEEIGRCRAFSPGWLENESIWLHMEYKYILEMLKTGLHEEFYAEFKNVLIPFLDPKIYGRSILENSSFLVSSAFPDKRLHGNGYVARLSGSTAEFIHIWLIMNCGASPFSLDESGRLNLTFKPCLAGWLFNKNGEYVFNFLSQIQITYHNPKRKNTYGKNSAKIRKIILQNKNQSQEINSTVIPAPYAEAIRSRQINKIDIYLD
ncbi:MAG TPA: cellobiose phosphorylase [Candidatus Omnitrophota bacterium]|nr:cellobiose phosphorylase [Candidatus Omnitrophota bacterium]HPT38920.1 cellobiose phosphorylase [Candidatus Omnitrophota bacterium]